jgi:hypothetical protein
MFAQTLVVGLLLAAPPAPAAGPRLEKGLEVLWSGTFTEASFRPGVRAIRTYDVDTRLFVLDTGDYGAEAILFTRVYLKPDRKAAEPPAGVVRLELVRIDPTGKVLVLPSPADPDNPAPKARPWPAVQLSGLPTHEAGLFFEHPDKPLKPGLTASGASRPSRWSPSRRPAGTTATRSARPSGASRRRSSSTRPTGTSCGWSG